MSDTEATPIGGRAEERLEEPPGGTRPPRQRTAEAAPPAGRGQPQRPHDFGNPEAVPAVPAPKRSWFHLLRRTVREFLDDGCTDRAAALTCYAALAVVPAALALLALLGVLGRGDRAVNVVVDGLRPLLSGPVLANVHSTLHGVATGPGGGIALVVGAAGALWSASAWVSAFSRAMNRIYEVEEGRPAWRLRPTMLLVTLASVALCAVALLIVVLSGPVADSVSARLGVGSTLLAVWAIAKWPVLAGVVVVVVALLFWATPNVRQPRFRLVSAGASVAILAWLAASVGFGCYVAVVASWSGASGSVFGAVGGVAVALLWLWLTNSALLLGGELDAELERARELAAGEHAEETLQLPVRDARGIRKAEERRRKDAETGRQVRESFGRGDPADRPFARR